MLLKTSLPGIILQTALETMAFISNQIFLSIQEGKLLILWAHFLPLLTFYNLHQSLSQQILMC